MDESKFWNVFHKSELKPKPFGDHNVDVEVGACIICISDLHIVTCGWGEYTGPLCIGHEVVSKVVKIGKHVKRFPSW